MFLLSTFHHLRLTLLWSLCQAFEYLYVQCRLQALRDTYVPALQRKADSLEADSTHDTQRLEELQADYALLEHELQVRLRTGLIAVHSHKVIDIMLL